MTTDRRKQSRQVHNRLVALQDRMKTLNNGPLWPDLDLEETDYLRKSIKELQILIDKRKGGAF